ncbi:formate hydrogenlyase subunit 6/NADH:ubiquinone oxidoreductase subunit I [Anaerosolibacter carboniphilus]|uniref:Formate hydrogenlyase subunit 6/NADH:ubiquinone oxidoreductase subunit I n=1 Tax=Anaerosolibacter carboniphilus TaxID=1417629 RepID=A0A841L0E8_9FIRM|nr:4Fe-4S binding protein [Anaerosolibacter carboniphilus]MBB6215865.1 formate hydrogenlyase subunit 6/NADH:ubiquinone oxidoreductase subunit I [Anaerosolibacter carboniphilus]
MAKGKPVIEYKNCMACGCCVQACPFSILRLEKIKLDKYNKAYPELVKAEECTGCGLCSKACPVECVEILQF